MPRTASAFVALAASLTMPLAATAAPARLTVKGSDTMVILAQRWAEQYMKRGEGVRVQVTGGGSGVGIAALINGTTDIATASRAMKDEEKAKVRERFDVGAVETAVAKDGVTFYVNAANPIGRLTLEQLRGIYAGEITSWKQLGGDDAPIVVYARESSSGTSTFVKEEVLGKLEYTPSAQALPGTAAVVNAVSKERNGIGYGGAAYLKGVKTLRVARRVGEDGVLPTEANVRAGAYPLSRSLFMVTRGAPTGKIKRFIDWVRSRDGQRIVTEVGYYPL